MSPDSEMSDWLKLKLEKCHTTMSHNYGHDAALSPTQILHRKIKILLNLHKESLIEWMI